MDATRILVGRFGAAHGVKGELRLKSFTAEPRAIADYGPLFDTSGAGRFVITALRLVKDDMLIARVEGIGTRAAAEALTNTDVFVARDRLPEAEEGEFYHADLIGLAAIGPAGESLGRVVAVLNFGGGDILELAPVGGGDTLLVPFTRAVVPVVDLAAGHVVIELPVEVDATSAADVPEPSPPGRGSARA